MSKVNRIRAMHIDSIGFLRILPPNREVHPVYDEGVARCSVVPEDTHEWIPVTMSPLVHAQRLAKDLAGLLTAAKIDVANHSDNYENGIGSIA